MATSNRNWLAQGAAEIIDQASLRRRLKSKKPLIIKLGIDPTSSQLHLGHAVVLRKLRQFQDAGHHAHLIIGDFTALIGDPSGVNKTRPVLTPSQIRANMRTYLEQAGRIINTQRARILYNSHWLRQLKLADFIGFARQITVNSLIEREDFGSRLRSKQSLSLHELVYSLIQAIDSVELDADVELGGWDQRLNLLLGRELQRKVGQLPQEIVMMKALIGTDGIKKMSSSADNFITLTDSADEMYGKIMRLPDALIENYGELAAWWGEPDEVKARLKSTLKLKEQKALVASAVVKLYHNQATARRAESAFDQTFRRKRVAHHLAAQIGFNQTTVDLAGAVRAALGRGTSRSESQRLIRQGGVSLDGVKTADPDATVDLTAERLLKIGKHRFFRLSRRR